MREDFDYGVSDEQLELSAVRIWPKVGDFTGLVDADLIPYIVGFSVDPLWYLQAKNSGDFENHKWWRWAKNKANTVLNTWLNTAGCDSAWLYLTDSASNFRNEVAVTRPYKEDRIGKPKPPFFHELREWLLNTHGAIMSEGNEADDMISIEAWRRILADQASGTELWTDSHKFWSSFCIITKDKDLKIIPTWHLDVNKMEKEWVEPLGELLPVYKTEQVDEFEYHPLFNGQPVPLSHCCFLDDDMNPLPYLDHPNKGRHAKRMTEELWFYSERGNPKLQDTFTRGKNKGFGKFKRIKVGRISVEVIKRLKGSGLKFFYSQLLTGDTADCYGGCKGIGASTAFHRLHDCSSEEELSNVVKGMYSDKYRHKAHPMLVEQGQLAWMQTKKGDMWEPLDESRHRSFPV